MAYQTPDRGEGSTRLGPVYSGRTMYDVALHAHSWLRWIALLVGLVAVARAFSGRSSGRPWARGDDRVRNAPGDCRRAHRPRPDPQGVGCRAPSPDRVGLLHHRADPDRHLDSLA